MKTRYYTPSTLFLNCSITTHLLFMLTRRHYLFFIILSILIGVSLTLPIRLLGKWATFAFIVYLYTVWAKHSQSRIIKAIIYLFALLFIGQTAILGFFHLAYGDEIDETTLFQALSNTNSNESIEFIQQNQIVLLYVSLMVLIFGACWFYIVNSTKKSAPFSLNKKAKALMIIGLLLHANPTFSKQNPITYWYKKLLSYEQQNTLLKNIPSLIQTKTQNIPLWNIQYSGSKDQIAVLVLGESLNKNNLQIYSYPRATTPQLNRWSSSTQMCIFTDVLAGAPSTQPAIDRMLSTKTIEQPDQLDPDVIMLAKAAGYTVYWLTNQKDHYLYAHYATQANELIETNIASTGRSNQSLDEQILPHWNKILNQPSTGPKLIVVHLLGQHPNYELRFPPQYNLFRSGDAVDTQLKEKGIFPWIRLQRNYYDNAIAYTDSILGQMIRDLEAHPQPSRLLFISDHGQEVGHTKNYTGHAPKLLSGYQVPMITWRNQQDAFDCAPNNQNKAFQSDRLDWGLLTFLNINTPKKPPQNDIFNPQFTPTPRWLGNKESLIK